VHDRFPFLEKTGHFGRAGQWSLAGFCRYEALRTGDALYKEEKGNRKVRKGGTKYTENARSLRPLRNAPRTLRLKNKAVERTEI